jgi:hypothetical protein
VNYKTGFLGEGKSGATVYKFDSKVESFKGKCVKVFETPFQDAHAIEGINNEIKNLCEIQNLKEDCL